MAIDRIVDKGEEYIPVNPKWIDTADRELYIDEYKRVYIKDENGNFIPIEKINDILK